EIPVHIGHGVAMIQLDDIDALDGHMPAADRPVPGVTLGNHGAELVAVRPTEDAFGVRADKVGREGTDDAVDILAGWVLQGVIGTFAVAVEKGADFGFERGHGGLLSRPNVRTRRRVHPAARALY